MRSRKITRCWLFVATLACSTQSGDSHDQAQADASPNQGSTGSPQDFVRDFYASYLASLNKDQASPPWSNVLAERPSRLEPELARLLIADTDRRAKAHGEIVGLDFDPFLNSQDPCDRYEVGSVEKPGENYQVNVHGVCSGKRNEEPDVVAEVAPKKNSWVLTNFHYPRTRADLRSILRQLAP